MLGRLWRRTLVAQAGDDLLGLHDRATHALGGGGEHQLGAERLRCMGLQPEVHGVAA